MDNKIVIEKIKQTGLDLSGLAVFGSGPICIRGWRDFNDIDLVVRPEVFEAAKKIPGAIVGEALRGGEEIKLVADGVKIELYDHWGPGVWDVEELLRTADDFDGVKFVSLENVLKWKRLLGRDKDQSDVELVMQKMQVK